MQFRGKELWVLSLYPSSPDVNISTERYRSKIIWSESYKALLRTRPCGRSVCFAVHSLPYRSETLLTAYANKFRPDSPAKLMHGVSSGVPTVYIDDMKAINSDIHGSYPYGPPRSSRRSDTARPGFSSAFTSYHSAKSPYIPIPAVTVDAVQGFCCRLSGPLPHSCFQHGKRFRPEFQGLDRHCCPRTSSSVRPPARQKLWTLGVDSHRLLRRWKELRTRCSRPAVMI
ncbi:hypothetical protein C8Q70DRAFT_293602 [Cubamyces menziesii]|nr:hypothetical protein C8Q70DRAFT_293602 [Cubamyces menziesii]